LEVLQRVQEVQPNLLVILFTAHATLDSAIAAVRAGAADYLLKPCTIRDIEAAVTRALQQRRERLRRQHLVRVIADALAALQAEEESEPPVPLDQAGRFLQCGPVTLDRERRLVVVRADHARSLTAELTGGEMALLAHLMQHPDTVLPYRELARSALGYDVSEIEAQGLVRPYISRLRKKIETDPERPLIRTVRGKGYFFSPPDFTASQMDPPGGGA
jgi:DNA-binding response OmpR family regulator